MLLKGCNLKAGVCQILKLFLEYFSIMYTFQNLNMGVKDKVRTDLDLH